MRWPGLREGEPLRRGVVSGAPCRCSTHLLNVQGVQVLEFTSDGMVDVSNVEMGNYFVKITTTDGRQLLAPIVVAN